MTSPDARTAIEIYVHQVRWTQTRLIKVGAAALEVRSATTDVDLLITCEHMALQLRSALECLAYATLATNRTAYLAARPDGDKDWNARRILRDIEAVNPNFYPWPFTIRMDTTGSHLDNADNYHLTRDAFVEAYEASSDLLHAPSPFRAQIDYRAQAIHLEKWAKLTTALLINHVVELPGHGFVIAYIEPKTAICHAQLAEPFGGTYVIRK